MDGWRQATRSRYRDMQDISDTFLWKLVQSKRKQQNSKWDKVKKKYCGKVIKWTIFAEDAENEIKMEQYADEIGVEISV